MEELKQMLARINHRYRVVDAIYHDAAAKLGLSDSVLYILYSLAEENRQVTQQELVLEWSLPKQTVNTAVANLARQGLVYLEQAEGKRKAVHLTAQGRQVAQEKLGPLVDAECRALARLSEEERAAYLALMERHTAYLREEIQHVPAH